MWKTLDYIFARISSLGARLRTSLGHSRRSCAFAQAILLCLAVPAVSWAAEVLPPDSTAKASDFRMVQYSKVTVEEKKVPLFSGYGIYTDICGLAMAQFAKWGQYEVGAHVGIKRRFYPSVELGIGNSNYADERSGLHYTTHSPYFRVGMDYNLNKDRQSKNRYYVGVRYGFSSFKYDLTGPDVTDDAWGGTFPFDYEGEHGVAHWGEALFGIQTQIWKFIHLGWTIRYKMRFHEKQATTGHAFYIPGYGKGGESDGCFGGSFNLVFELK